MTTPNVPLGAGAVEIEKAHDVQDPKDWHFSFGSVFDANNPNLPNVILDGDTALIPTISLIGRVAAGDRVSVLTVPPSGNYVTSIVNNPYPRLIARAERATSSTPAAGAQGVLRIDNVLVPANHLIMVDTSVLLIFSTVAGDTGSARFSYTTTGTAATTGSTLLTLWSTAAIATLGGGTGGILSHYLPVSTSAYKLSLLLYTLRVSGTGLISLFNAAGVHTTQMRIWDWGPVPADTGVSI